MPSQQEVLENGQNLGEMNKLLLNKVEELTLYLIEKDRQLEEQKNKINEISVDFAQMKKEIVALKAKCK